MCIRSLGFISCLNKLAESICYLYKFVMCDCCIRVYSVFVFCRNPLGIMPIKYVLDIRTITLHFVFLVARRLAFDLAATVFIIRRLHVCYLLDS
jgi:hypothetical protein